MIRPLLAIPVLALAASAQVSTKVDTGQIVITNDSKVSLEAFEVTWTDPHGRPAFTFEDAKLQPSFHSVAAGGQWPVGFDGKDAALTAALFADGSTFGNARRVQILLERRAQYAASLDAFIKELKAAEPQTTLVHRLEALRDSELASLQPLPPETARARREAVNILAHFVLANASKAQELIPVLEERRRHM